MAIKCPWCLSENTKVIGTRTKKAQARIKTEKHGGYKMSDIPFDIRSRDYVIRSHRCQDCFNTFMTIESYYRGDEIKAFNSNSQKLQGI